jgi:hypothetical protein
LPVGAATPAVAVPAVAGAPVIAPWSAEAKVVPLVAVDEVEGLLGGTKAVLISEMRPRTESRLTAGWSDGVQRT